MRTARTATLPPFYTHVIGSLPRPLVVRDLLSRKASMDKKEYQAILDDFVRFAIHLQELAGLDVVSDGEWRRWHYVGEFLTQIGGFEKVRPFEHAGEKKMHDVVVKRIPAKKPVWAKDAKFLARNTDRYTKFAIPSPFLIAIRYWHEDYSRQAYPTIQHFLEHLAEVLRREAEAIADAGVDVIQLDDPALTYFCDRRLMGSGDTHDDRLRRGWDIDRQFPEAVNAINHIVQNVKGQVEVHLHCCHSVYKRQSDVQGDYKPILPRLAEAHIDRINIEFAYRDTGSPEDLRLLPPGLGVGMGVLDVRGERLQSVEEIEALGAAGAAIVSPERIALNPDCGFAPDFGEPPTIDEAFEKLQRLCEASRRLRARFAAPAAATA